jgi:hypothetical protein
MRIIDDILDFSKIEAGKLELEEGSVEIRACAESALDLVAVSASKKEIELGCLVDDDVPAAIVGDATRLKQALGSLNLAAVALLDDGPSMFPRPSWIWWSDDHGFIRSWEAETLRSLTPAVAEPAFRAAISFASKQDNRERPFLVAGLAGVLEQCDAVEEASDQAIQALVLARAVRADAAFSRIRRIYSRLSLRAPQNSYVRSLGDALYDI